MNVLATKQFRKFDGYSFFFFFDIAFQGLTNVKIAQINHVF